MGDAVRWNERYQQSERVSFEQPRSLLVEYANLLPPSGLALDAAIGLGWNAYFLSQHGLRVIGVDISDYALRQAKTNLPGLMAIQADMTNFYIPSNTFDVILNFFYLQREIFPIYLSALRPGGVLFFESLNIDMLNVRPNICVDYLLRRGELKCMFETISPGSRYELLLYWEGWKSLDTQHPRAVSSLIARRLSD